jgi:tetratricopeptide (TPR) repeat protein
VIRWSLVLLAGGMCCAFALGGCAPRENPSALYVLEELETASAVKKPQERVSRLDIFIKSHPASPYRMLAYQRALDALAKDMRDDSAAARYLDQALAREKDVAARGDLLYWKFSHLYETDQPAALALADSLLPVERSPRLFLYMGYDLSENKARPDLAEKCFLEAAALATQPIMKQQAIAMAGTYLESIGKKDEAVPYLKEAAGNPDADMTLGKILWGEGDRNEALDAYIRCVARMPGARKYVRLDSLYAIVHPGATDLDGRIMTLRIVDEGPLPDGTFVDLDGRTYDLSKLKGTKVVINALSPT